MNTTHCGRCLVDNRVNSHQLLLSSPGAGRWPGYFQINEMTPTVVESASRRFYPDIEGSDGIRLLAPARRRPAG
eukprot:SAG31_NODE_16998_length_687_cov_0.950680_1_plen_73_part_10